MPHPHQRPANSRPCPHHCPCSPARGRLLQVDEALRFEEALMAQDLSLLEQYKAHDCVTLKGRVIRAK